MKPAAVALRIGCRMAALRLTSRSRGRAPRGWIRTMEPRTPLSELVRRSAAMARKLADTARLHNEPEVAARFERLAADGEARARYLAEIEGIRASILAETERRIVEMHLKAVRELEGQTEC